MSRARGGGSTGRRKQNEGPARARDEIWRRETVVELIQAET